MISSRHTLIPALLLCLAAPLAAQERSRFGVARYDAPAGWRRCEEQGALVLTSPDGDARLVLGASHEMAGAVADVLAAELTRVGQNKGYRLEARQEGGRHTKSKGRWCGAVCSYESPNRPGRFDYEWITVVGGGGRSVVATTVFADKAAYDRLGAAAAGVVNDLQLSTLMVVERGSPNLTRFAIDETVDFLEWLMQNPFTDEQRATVEGEVRGFWRDRSEKDIEDIGDLLDARKELAKLNAAERELARQSVLEQALAQWREERDSPSAKMMLAIHEASHRPLAAGEPPLTRQAVDAFTEYLYFAAGHLADVDGKPGKDVKDKFAAEVAAGYGELPQEQRATIAGMPMLWAALRVVWPDMPQEQRRQWIDGWGRSEAIANLGKQLRAQKEAASAAASMSSLAARQAQMQAQQAQFQMMQNVLRMQSDTMRIIASNIGGNTTYVYRW